MLGRRTTKSRKFSMFFTFLFFTFILFLFLVCLLRFSIWYTDRMCWYLFGLVAIIARNTLRIHGSHQDQDSLGYSSSWWSDITSSKDRERNKKKEKKNFCILCIPETKNWSRRYQMFTRTSVSRYSPTI